MVKRYAEDHPEQEWIAGASCDSSLAPQGLFDARWLDSVVPDRPVVLRAWDYHTVWCNSIALDRAGITPDTPQTRHWVKSRTAQTVPYWERCANGARWTW